MAADRPPLPYPDAQDRRTRGTLATGSAQEARFGAQIRTSIPLDRSISKQALRQNCRQTTGETAVGRDIFNIAQSTV
jgi:hypothetical protein